MKKKLFLFILLVTIFSYINVQAKVADVSIKSIEMIEKSGNVEVIDSATFDNLNINYNLLFRQVNDSVKYKITIDNNGQEDVYINNKGQISESEYIAYDYIWDDDQNVIKANSEKTFTLSITYKKQIETAKLDNGTYSEEKNLVIKISDKKGNDLPAKNPNTYSSLSILIILLSVEILAVIITTIIMIKNKKLNIGKIKQLKKYNTFSIVIFLVLALGTTAMYSYALEVAEIKLNSVIKISKARLARSCYSDSFALEHPYWGKSGHAYTQSSSELNTATSAINNYCIDWNSLVNFQPFMDYIYGGGEAAEQSELTMRNQKGTYLADDTGPYVDIITSKTKTMNENINRYGINYTLIDTADVSDQQNGEVILGIYQGQNNRELLLVIGEDGGVQAPIDSSWLFATEELELDGATENEINIFEIPKEEINELKNVEPNIMLFASEMELDNISFSETNNMSGMFNFNGLYTDYTYLTGLKNWDTSMVKDMSGMFFMAGNHDENGRIEGISNLDTHNVINMQGMFTGSDVDFVSGDLSNWNTSKVKDMAGMFSGAFNYKTKLNISNWDVSSVEDMTYMFANGLNSLTYFDISKWNTINVKSMYGMFQSSLEIVKTFDLSKWNTSNVETMSGMFIETLYEIEEFDISNWNTAKVKDMQDMFSHSLDNLSELDLSNWNVSNVENMSGMFSSSLYNTTKLDLSNWAPTNVKNVSDMFNTSFANSPKVDLYINNLNLNRFTNPNQFEYIFYGMPVNENVTIYVNSNKEKEWLLNLNTDYISSEITPNNIKVI